MQLEVRIDESRASQTQACGHLGLNRPPFGDQPVQNRVLNSVPGPCPLDASSALSVVTIKSVCIPYQTCPGVNTAPAESPGLEVTPRHSWYRPLSDPGLGAWHGHLLKSHQLYPDD